jgi:hypothetical protein
LKKKTNNNKQKKKKTITKGETKRVLTSLAMGTLEGLFVVPV